MPKISRKYAERLILARHQVQLKLDKVVAQLDEPTSECTECGKDDYDYRKGLLEGVLGNAELLDLLIDEYFDLQDGAGEP